MKNHLYWLLLVFSPALLAQNLVPNPGFEDISNCDLYFDQLRKASPWQAYHFTPDVFHACSESPFMRTPSNTFDVQPPASGKAYAGFLTYHWEYDHELIGVKLLQPVKAGKSYEVRFKISRAAAHARYATNNIGLLFTNRPEETHLAAKAHLRLSEVVEESDIWYEVKGIVAVEQDFTHLVIGNFFPDEATEIRRMPGGSFDAAYYYLDEVYVGLAPAGSQPQSYSPPAKPQNPVPVLGQTPKPKPQAPPVPPAADPLQTAAILGTVYDAETKKPLAAEVSYVVPNTKTKNVFETDYRTGQYAFSGLVPQAFVLEVSARNYYTRVQNFQAGKGERLNQNFYLQPLNAGQSIALRGLVFEREGTDLDPASFPELNRLVQILRDNPKMKIELGGYTDQSGRVDIARRRAEMVQQYLLEIGGIAPERLRLNAFFETEPSNRQDRAAQELWLPERVEFRILN
ncbi:MAG: hypothetical protein OHK0053_27970 [Microscillaceae bacterium]